MVHSDPTAPIREEGLLLAHIAPITIKRGACVTVGAIVLPGVTAGENSIVAAGAVLTKDVLAYTVVSGSPAKVTKELRRVSEAPTADLESHHAIVD